MVIRPGSPAAKEIMACFWNLFRFSKERYSLLIGFLSKMRYQRRAREGIVYVMVLPSSRSAEKEIASGDSTLAENSNEKPDAYIPGKKRTKYSISGSREMVGYLPFDRSMMTVLLYTI